MKRIHLYNLLIICALVICAIWITACDTSVEDNSKKKYDVSDEYFAFSDFNCSTLTTIGVDKNSSASNSYELKIRGTCTVSFYEYTIAVKAYSKQDSLLLNKTETCEKNVAANKEFEHAFEITLAQKQQIARIEVEYSGKSYDNPDNFEKAAKLVDVIFMNGSTQVSNATVVMGETVTAPKNPTKPNYIFDAWYTDRNCTNEYDFSQKVTGNLTLYAGFIIDAVTLTNNITQEVMCGIVTIYNELYNTQKIFGIDTGIKTNSQTSQGSGFIFYMQDKYCYVITNNHVINSNGKYEHQKLIVEDYQGYQYEAHLYSNLKASKTPARSAEYDLAVVWFRNSSSNLKKIPLASYDPQVGTDVISLGSPENQVNAIKYGKVQNYQKTAVSNTTQASSHVTFDVMKHTARTDSGSSGGPILNTDLQVVGVHYAGQGTFGWAIPAEKLQEFLKTYFYNTNS